MIQNLRVLVPSSYQNKFGFTIYFEGDYVVTRFISMGIVGQVQCAPDLPAKRYEQMVKKMIKGVMIKIDAKLEDISRNMVKQMHN